MTNDIIHKSSDILWNEAMAELANCADTVHEQDIVQDVKESGKFTLDNVVDLFDENLDGVVDAFDSKAWFCRSFLTSYVDIGFEDGLVEQYQGVMKSGIAVDKLKLLDKIRALPLDEEIGLLDQVIDLTEDDIVVKKAFFRLQDIGANEVLNKEQWHEFATEYKNGKIKYFWAHKVEGDEDNIEELVVKARAILNSKAVFKEKTQAFVRLLSYDHLSIEALCIEVVQGNYEVDLQIEALKYLRGQATQTSFDALKAEVLREHDGMYQFIEAIGFEPDKHAASIRRDKQSYDYRTTVNRAFSEHRLFDATTEVRKLLAGGHTDLRSFDMSGADLSGLDFSGADLSGAVLSGADLTQTNLSSQFGYQNITIHNVKFGDVDWFVDFDDVWKMWFADSDGADCYNNVTPDDIETIKLFQKETNFVTCNQIKALITSKCRQCFYLGLDLLTDDMLTPEMVDALLEPMAIEDNYAFNNTVLATEKLKIIHEKYGKPDWQEIEPYVLSGKIEVCRCGVYVAGEICGAEAIHILMARLKRGHVSEVMLEVSKALVKIHKRCGKVPIDDVIEVLTANSSSVEQEMAALYFLGEIKYKEAGSFLWNLLTKDIVVAEVNQEELVSALIKIQNEHQCITTKEMVAELDAIVGVEVAQLGDGLQDRKKDKDAQKILEFMKGVAVSEEAVPLLLKIVGAKNVFFNMSARLAIDVLVNIAKEGGYVPVEAVLSLLDKRQEFLAPLLGVIGAADAVPELMRRLESSEAKNYADAYAQALIEIHKKTGAVPVDKIKDISINAEHVCARNGAKLFFEGIED